MPKQTTIDLRSPDAAEAHRAAVLAFLRDSKSPVSSTDVVARVGGTPDQARRVLNALIADGQVSWSGNTRATRYFVT